MSNWMIKATEDWLTPVYDALHEMICMRDILFADETTLQVLNEPGKTAQSESYMWLYRTAYGTGPPIVLYDYRPDRKAKNPEAFLAGFTGYLQVDGYKAYRSLEPGITIVGCFSHCRRKFDEALKALDPKDHIGSGALAGKHFCDKLFAIERSIEDCDFDERYRKRLELARPVLDDFRLWLKKRNPTPKSKFGIAVNYALNQWEYLERYLLDGRLEISTNRAERSIKPFVICRKNFLFANTPRGAKCSAIMFSIIETAKENGLNPYEYLTYIFKNAPGWDIRNNIDALECLLPHFAPSSCKAASRQN